MNLALVFFTLFSINSFAQMPTLRGIGTEIQAKKNCYPLHIMQKRMLQQIKDDIVYTLPVKKEIKIAVIDTGLDYSIPAFKDKIYVPASLKKTSLAYGVDVTKMDNEPNDTHGHGTHVAGIILSLFPSAKIFPIKYYDAKASSVKNADNFTKAIEIAVYSGVDIINISGGGPEFLQKEKRILEIAKQKNILIVSAAGNEQYEINPKYPETQYYPASYGLDNNIVVMALEPDGRNKMEKSNWGSIIDISAVGTVLSYGQNSGCTQELSGTSQATPVVTALAAMIKSFKPELTPQQIKRIIIQQADLIPQKEQKVYNKVSVHGKPELIEMNMPKLIRKVSIQSTLQYLLFNQEVASNIKP